MLEQQPVLGQGHQSSGGQVFHHMEGWADNQLIATRDCCEVKDRNSVTVHGRRTQPLLTMAIQITHKQERGTNILSLHQQLMLVNNQKYGHLGQGCGKD